MLLTGCAGALLLLTGMTGPGTCAVLLPPPDVLAKEEPDKTLSPYFFVKSDNPRVDRLPLRSTHADVTISGVIADVTVTQVYKNEGKNTLEAIYIFPASSRAAVYAMRMTVGRRTIEAKIQERRQARETYEKALQEGETASLLEQQRPNVFQMNVGNILPGDEIKVALNYTELLVPEDNIYEFVYPTVAGPRYTNQQESATGTGDKWTANPYLHEGKDAPFTFEFALTLNSGIPIAGLTSPSHDVAIEYLGRNMATIGLQESNRHNNRDVVVRYSLAGDKIEGGLLMNFGKEENFFLLMLEPPERVNTNMITPREYIFIIDVSGSMNGFPLNTAKSLMNDLFKNLRPADFFNVILFAGDNAVLSEKSIPATLTNQIKALKIIDNQHGGGGTELMPALHAAMAMPRVDDNISRSMIIVTDGYISAEKDVFEYIRQNLNKGNVFSFGIGSSVNRLLIEGMARAGMGEPFIILNEAEARIKAKQFKEYIESPVLTDIKVKFDGMQVSDVEPRFVPDLFAKKPVVVFGKYHGAPRGTVTITGMTAERPYRRTISLSSGEISLKNKALRYLWARHRIVRLADMVKMQHDDRRIQQITRLGLDYNLLTDYTSFVAVDTEIRTDGKPKDTVKQPLPLPQGVGDSAVGGMGYAAKGMRYKTQRRTVRSRLPLTNTMEMSAAPSARDKSLHEEAEYSRLLKPYKPMVPPKVEGKKKEAAPDTDDQVRPSVTLKVLTVTGQLDKAAVEKAVARQQSLILREVEHAELFGLVTFDVIVDTTGKIIKVVVVQDTFGKKKLSARLQQLIRRIQFSATRDGKVASVKLMIQATP